LHVSPAATKELRDYLPPPHRVLPRRSIIAGMDRRVQRRRAEEIKLRYASALTEALLLGNVALRVGKRFSRVGCRRNERKHSPKRIIHSPNVRNGWTL
jgi:hypothetical protein